MKVDLKNLTEIISHLPDPETYEYPEFHKIVIEPIAVLISSQIPKSGNAKQLVFKKHFNRGKFEWCLEY